MNKKYFKYAFLLVFAFVLLLPIIISFNNNETPVMTENPQIGMTSKEVSELLGEPNEILNTEADSLGKVRYRWWYENRGYIYFADNKVVLISFKDYMKP